MLEEEKSLFKLSVFFFFQISSELSEGHNGNDKDHLQPNDNGKLSSNYWESMKSEFIKARIGDREISRDLELVCPTFECLI